MRPNSVSHTYILLIASLALPLMSGCGEDKQATKPAAVTKQAEPFADKTPAADTTPKPATEPVPQPAPTPRSESKTKPAPVARIEPATKPAPAAKPAPEQNAGATSPGNTLRETELKEKPFLDARTLRTLPANTALTILERQGGWMHVNAAGQQGWVRMLNVRTGTGTTTTGSDASTVTTLATGRAGSGNIVATSGIRGLDEEQLKTARGDPAQLQKMESYARSKQDAAQYAAKHGLKASALSYLPPPEGK